MEEKNFEEALEKIDKIVEELEEGELSLKESINKFKQGSELLKFCKKELNGAEMDVKKIIDENGVVKFEGWEV